MLWLGRLGQAALSTENKLILTFTNIQDWSEILTLPHNCQYYDILSLAGIVISQSFTIYMLQQAILTEEEK